MDESAAMEWSLAWPKVSVVIPTYNRAGLVGQAIQSVLDQRYPHLEVIVVDDGSTDHTADVVRAFAGPVRYVRQDNAGPAAARNRGLELATGDLVAFLDSDDLFLPGKLHEQVQYIRQYPQTVLVYCWFEVVDSSGRRRLGRRCRLTGHAGRKLLARSMQGPLATPTIVARRHALLAAGGFDTSMKLSEDVDLWCRVARLGPLGLVPEVLVTVRRFPDGVSRAPARRSIYAASRRILDKAFIADGSIGSWRRTWLSCKAYLFSWLVALGRILPPAPSFWLRALWTNPLATLRSLLPSKSRSSVRPWKTQPGSREGSRRAA